MLMDKCTNKIRNCVVQSFPFGSMVRRALGRHCPFPELELDVQKFNFVKPKYFFKTREDLEFENADAGNTKGGSITVPLTSCLTGPEISCMATNNFCFYLQNRLIQTSQTGGQQYSDTSPFSIPWLMPLNSVFYKTDYKYLF
jgi:hypothetical protein